MKNIRLANYNILSASLSVPSHYPSCDPQNLHLPTRFSRIVGKLEKEIKNAAVITLQEVPLLWLGPLHSLFQQRNYHFISSSYGSTHNGYMGNALAFPIADYQLVDADVSCVAETKKWANVPQRQPRITSFIILLLTYFIAILSYFPLWGAKVKNLYKGVKAGLVLKYAFNPWVESRDRKNTLIFVRLQPKKKKETSESEGKKQVICVACYHMPCAFWAPQVMVIHSALAAQRAQHLAGQDPLILAGDWNVEPTTNTYRFVLTGGPLPESSRDHPSPIPNDSWRPVLKYPFKSAYKEALGHEPEFTNYARPVGADTYMGTLDYIFLSPSLRTIDVLPLPAKQDVLSGGVYPNSTEPSDHMLVAATIALDPK